MINSKKFQCFGIICIWIIILIFISKKVKNIIVFPSVSVNSVSVNSVFQNSTGNIYEQRNKLAEHDVGSTIVCNCSEWQIPVEWLSSDLTFESFKNQLELRDCTDPESVGDILLTRQTILEKECKLLGINKDISANWTWQPISHHGKLNLDKNYNYTVCPVPKAGSNSWRFFAKILKEEKISPMKKISILPVRHPFTRLASVFNDLFCRGALFKCCRENNMSRFTGCLYGWWIPILISSGRLEINYAFSEEMKNIKPIKGNTGRVHMINYVLHDAVKKSYSEYEKKILDEYKDIVLSFKDFVNHIFWTHENNIADHHWNPETSLCDACRIPYSYIIHLENADKEIPYILKALGFQNIPMFNKLNVRSNHSESQYINYYYDLPISMVVKLFKYYQFDFKLIGYSL